MLFYDPILSGDKDVACASCHHPENGYAEFLDISIGVNGRGLNSLKEVLEFYEDLSFGKTRNPSIPKERFDPLVKELVLSVKEMAPIISFLNSLNDENFDREVPEKVPSGLAVGANIE